jgi:c-di-GMP-binding flagellar brake protein YcgR
VRRQLGDQTGDHVLFARKVQELIDVAPRRFYRVGLNISIDGTRNERPLAFSLQNISTRGMLIRSGESLAQGESIACSFYLPDGKHLSATGKVIRVVKPASDIATSHYGVRFSPLPRRRICDRGVHRKNPLPGPV